MFFQIGDWVRFDKYKNLGEWSEPYRDGLFQIKAKRGHMSRPEEYVYKLTIDCDFFEFLGSWLSPAEVKTPAGNIVLDFSL